MRGCSRALLLLASLFDALRTQSGKTYAVNSRFLFDRTSGVFAAATFTRNAEVASTTKLFLAEIAKLKSGGITDDELVSAKATLIGHFGLDLETGAAALEQLVTAELDGLPPTFVSRLPDCYAKLTRDDVTKAAAASFDVQSLVLVGPAKTLVPQLEAAGFARLEVVRP